MLQRRKEEKIRRKESEEGELIKRKKGEKDREGGKGRNEGERRAREQEVR